MNNNKGFFYNNCNKYGENSVNIISRQFELNELTILYFSNDNIELLQEQIQKYIYFNTTNNILIKKQNYDELKIIMRSIFLSEKPKLTDYQDVIEQVRRLNKLVTLECSRIIMTNLEQHLSYLTDISKDLNVFSLGTATSVKGTRTGEFEGF